MDQREDAHRIDTMTTQKNPRTPTAIRNGVAAVLAADPDCCLVVDERRTLLLLFLPTTDGCWAVCSHGLASSLSLAVLTINERFGKALAMLLLRLPMDSWGPGPPKYRRTKE